ncbi:MAG: hypothetical protein WA985_10450 [Erythrobacter sp.]
MLSKNTLAAVVTLSFLSPLALACGNATEATAEPEPDEPVDVAAFERDLSASQTVPEEVGQIDSACRAPLAEPFIGESMDLETRQALLDAVEPQVKIRFVEPDMEVLTDDLVNDRLNVRTDENDEIVEVYCG